MNNLKGHPWNEEEINLILAGKFSEREAKELQIKMRAKQLGVKLLG